MFVKKLVERASIKKPGGGSWDGLKSSDVEPRLVFHYGIPSGATKLAYDSLQQILAVSTQDGRIKLFGRDNTQQLLESPEPVPSKFLQFIHNKAFLLNVTSDNHIQVWDIGKNLLSHVHVFKADITALTVMQYSLFMYVGDSSGNVSIFKLNENPCLITQMKYTIPLSASRGTATEVFADSAVVHLLPQPSAESKRVLIVFRDGLMTLWEIRESRSIFTTVGSSLPMQHHETKKATSGCWVCPFGSKVALGYSNGEILVWSIPAGPNLKTEVTSDSSSQCAPISKLNLGYKLDKIPIASLKWAYADGKASRLYVMGASDFASSFLAQVLLLNEHTETRMVKLGLHLSEPTIDMELTSSSFEHSKHKLDCLVLLGKSGHIFAYDDHLIEKYLLQSQSRGSPSLPKEITIKMPFSNASITVAKFITNNQSVLGFGDEDYAELCKNIPPLFPCEPKPKDASCTNLVRFSGFASIRNLYITGHIDGAINFWDVTCPFFIPVLSLKQQSEDDFSLSGVPLTALYFDTNSRLLVSGDQSGMVRIFKFKPEPYASENSFIPFQVSKKGNSHIIQSVKLLKVNGSVLHTNVSQSSGHLAVGSDQGYVSLIDIEGPTVLYEMHIASEIVTGIVSLQFGTCSLHGFEKNILVVATKDSSILALDSSTGNKLSTSTVHPKKPSGALFMQILHGQDMSARGSNASNVSDSNNGIAVDDAQKQSFVLICSEKAVYIYSLSHVVQGIKKVYQKKKFHSTSCCWASTFYSSTDLGLILLFPTGRIEIRSLPELSLVRESSVRGFTYSLPKLNSFSDSSICCSHDGELVMVNGDQETLVVSVLLQKEKFRLLDSVSQVYRRDLIVSQEGLATSTTITKEKKKGIISSVMKGSKQKQIPQLETEDTRESIEELSTLFSTANFAFGADNKDSMAVDENETELDIDDIDLEYLGEQEKHKDQNLLAALKKQKLASKFQALTGKIKQMKVKNEKHKEESLKEDSQDEKGDAVDQIKKKYGFSSSGEAGAAKMAESKLQDNIQKLQGINLRATEMQDTAKSFSSMAKEMLRIAEKDKRSL